MSKVKEWGMSLDLQEQEIIDSFAEISGYGAGFGNHPDSSESTSEGWDANGSPISESAEDLREREQRLCYHEWATYIGLQESFEYCIKCDKRKD